MLRVDTIFVQVFARRFVVTNVDSGASTETHRDRGCASPRMVIADFTMAMHQLKQAVKSVRRGLRAPIMLIHPMELIEGGVTQVEYRVFGELGTGAGAAKAAVYTGAPLTGEAVKQAIRDYKG